MRTIKMLRDLNEVLSKLYPTVADSLRIVEDTGIKPAYISFSNKSINNWHNILTEAEKQNKINNLVQVALEEYSENAELTLFFQHYLIATKGGQSDTA